MEDRVRECVQDIGNSQTSGVRDGLRHKLSRSIAFGIREFTGTSATLRQADDQPKPSPGAQRVDITAPIR